MHALHGISLIKAQVSNKYYFKRNSNLGEMFFFGGRPDELSIKTDHFTPEI